VYRGTHVVNADDTAGDSVEEAARASWVRLDAAAAEASTAKGLCVLKAFVCSDLKDVPIKRHAVAPVFKRPDSLEALDVA